jgi:hypothetical protein
LGSAIAFAELADEAVAFEEQRRDAKRQVHLRRSDTSRHFHPAWSSVTCEPCTTIFTSFGPKESGLQLRKASSVVWLLPTQE